MTLEPTLGDMLAAAVPPNEPGVTCRFCGTVANRTSPRNCHTEQQSKKCSWNDTPRSNRRVASFR